MIINLAQDFVIFASVGQITALNRSTAVAVSVNTLTDSDTVSIKGTTLHMILGRYQVCSRAAWNLNGIANKPVIASARAKLTMKKFVVFCNLRKRRKMSKKIRNLGSEK